VVSRLFPELGDMGVRRGERAFPPRGNWD